MKRPVDEVSIAEARDQMFGADRDDRCCDCGQRKDDVGEFSDEATGELFCRDCGDKEVA